MLKIPSSPDRTSFKPSEWFRGGKIDCVFTYKVDRLSRSLLDFTKLVEVFDRHTELQREPLTPLCGCVRQ